MFESSLVADCDFWMDENKPQLSIEGALGIIVGIVAATAAMGWELRSILVAFAIVLVVHIARRISGGATSRLGIAVAVIAALILVTWRPIWEDFHKNFPAIGGEAALSRVIIAAVVFAIGLAGYWSIIRPRGKGWRVIPVQLMIFGACVGGLGLVATAVGIIWQVQQNWANGMKPSAPIFTVGPPQITQREPPPALPAPQPSPQPFFSDYNLTEAGIGALAEELYKVRSGLTGRIEVDRMSTDGTSGGFISNFSRACDKAGIECPVANVHPNSPDEKGLMIYISDINKPPEPAQVLQATLLKIGVDVPFVARPGYGPMTFSLFAGPKP